MRGRADPRLVRATNRHRLNRGGDRQANAALYRFVLCRLRWDPRTRAYAQRRTAEGLSKPEIIRCLKRYIAREIYHALLDPQPALCPGDYYRRAQLAFRARLDDP